MIDTDAVAAACNEMKREGYSLVLITANRWCFAKGSREFPENPALTEPLIKAGDILRMGNWSSPIHALEAYGQRLLHRER